MAATAAAAAASEPSADRPRAAPLLPVTRSLRSAYPCLDYAAYPASGSLLRDARAVFPAAPPAPLALVPVLQRAAVPLDTFGDAQAAEKDLLQGRFFAWAAEVRDALQARGGFWADATDPATGAALFGDQAALYSDVPPIARLMRCPTHDAGGCTILLHPEWRSAVYPASFFTTAPQDVLAEVLRTVNAAEADGERDLLPGGGGGGV